MQLLTRNFKKCNHITEIATLCNHGCIVSKYEAFFIETYNLVGKVKALTFVSAFLYYITIPILPYKLISVSIDFELSTS